MMHNCILAIDQGTTGTTCLVVGFDPHQQSHILGRGYAELPQHFAQPGWVEHSLDEIWQSVLQAINQALDAAHITAKNLVGIGLTNQRETCCAWDTQGTPLHHAIVWQDRRTATECQALQQQGLEPMVQKRTGLLLDPYFTGTKLSWMLHHVPAVQQAAAKQTLRVGTVDSWLLFKLTGHKTHATDITNAARTLLFDIVKQQWDTELCELLGHIPLNALPRVGSNTERYGTTRSVPNLADGIPIVGMAGDQHAALLGQGCIRAGMAKCTYGTGAFVLVNTGDQPIFSKHRLLTTVAWQLGQAPPTYALEGSVFVAGSVVQWLRDGLQFFSKSQQINALANSVPDSDGVLFVPALTGLGAPYWQPNARGTIFGITRGTTQAHIARAALEGVAFTVHDLIHALEQDYGAPLKDMRVDGGAAANDLMMQFQADLLGNTLYRTPNLESTALGAAYLAALSLGMIDDLQTMLSRHQTTNSSAWQSFSPKKPAHQVNKALQRWQKAVQAVQTCL